VAKAYQAIFGQTPTETLNKVERFAVIHDKVARKRA